MVSQIDFKCSFQTPNIGKSNEPRARHMTMAEWVRQALHWARRREPLSDVDKKLAVVRAAVQSNGPTADIEQMLEEIERGYLSDSQPGSWSTPKSI